MSSAAAAAGAADSAQEDASARQESPLGGGTSGPRGFKPQEAEPSAPAEAGEQQQQQAALGRPRSTAPVRIHLLSVQVNAATSEMLRKISRYIEGEVDLSLEDYRLMEARLRCARPACVCIHSERRVPSQALNLAAAGKYSDMSEYSAGLVALAERLQAKSTDLLPQLEEIGKLETQVQQLEGAVQQLDSYSRSLEAKFRTIDDASR
jgi:hypothetical protein